MQYKQGPGEKPAKRRFGRLFTTKVLYGVVQETWGSIVGVYASLQYMCTLCILVRVCSMH